ncbi:Aste57867_14672 [Aphanomyces stellatus]|uniref:Aste57867_14672 protein n=1 Tax=Aphanomyces stellatus TaxID=120398 RepID=A0A485L1A7_9STRA|nr:hypothetical protein As57867_014617 [Aphanomyces stellatus]VFT91490.1 Aste57867_14672 [Aphanomyces stellatus]
MLTMPTSWPVFRSSRVSDVHALTKDPTTTKQRESTLVLCSGGDCCDDLVTAVLTSNTDKILFFVEQNGCDINRVSVCRVGDPCVSPACVRRAKLPSDLATHRSFQSLPSDAQPTCGYSLLQIAVQAGELASVDLLLDLGASPAVHADTSPSCLSMALAQGDEISYRILKHSAAHSVPDDAVDAVSTLGSLPLFTAMASRLTSAQRVKAIATAAAAHHLHIVQLLLDTGDDAVIQKGLHAMVQQGCLALVRHVVKSYGPSVVLYCEPNHVGDSLLHTACRANQPELIKYLIRCGVDVNAPNAIGVSALYMCSALGADLSVRMLLKAGAQPYGALGPRGDSALHVAVQENHLQVVRVLVHGGAPLETQNQLGYTALHVACMQGHASIAAYLLRKGASVHATNAHGDTPLAKACQMHHRRLVDLLVSHDGGAVSASADVFHAMNGGRHKITKTPSMESTRA